MTDKTIISQELDLSTSTDDLLKVNQQISTQGSLLKKWFNDTIGHLNEAKSSQEFYPKVMITPKNPLQNSICS